MGDKPWWRDPRGMPPGLRTPPQNSERVETEAGARVGRRGWLVLASSIAVLAARVLLGVAGVSSGYTWLFASIALSSVGLVALAVAALKPRRSQG